MHRFRSMHRDPVKNLPARPGDPGQIRMAHDLQCRDAVPGLRIRQALSGYDIEAPSARPGPDVDDGGYLFISDPGRDRIQIRVGQA